MRTFNVIIKNKGVLIEQHSNISKEEAQRLFDEFTNKGYDIIVILKREVKL